MPGSAAVGFLALWYSPVLRTGQSPVLPEPLQEPKGIPLSKLPVGTGPEVDSVTLTPSRDAGHHRLGIQPGAGR